MYPVSILCQALDVHPSGYYAWLKEPLSQRDHHDKRLSTQIKQYWLESGGLSGYRNVHQDLLEASISCGRDRVLRIMRQEGIRAQRGYKAPKAYFSGKPHPAAPNLLERQFEVTAPNRWWVSDITYIHTQEGFLFLAVVMDLFARNIVGWSMGSRITDDLVLDALTMAYWRRKPIDKVMLHSDQGSQYKSNRCKRLLKTLNIEPSMSRRGNCHDNAVAESFFANLKKEKIRKRKYKSRADARLAMFNYIEMFYNPKRRHTHNNRVAPTVYEHDYLTNQNSV
jgi:putative transposase